tara:strand:+ start:960 stop:1175 length:216 start_codon:yes stop_codon:yes gene_type:complete
MTDDAIVHALGYLSESQLEDLVIEVTVRSPESYDDLDELIEYFEEMKARWGGDTWDDGLAKLKAHKNKEDE